MKAWLRKWLFGSGPDLVVRLEEGKDTTLIFVVDGSTDHELACHAREALMAYGVADTVIFIPRGVEFHKAIQS